MSRKKIYILSGGLALVFLYLFAPVVSASASLLYQALTPTPTVTAPPIYFPTINPTLDGGSFACPAVGTPIVGWGTVTPDSLWDLMCSQCVLTPYATNTGVPYPTVTGTPPTATITPTATTPPETCFDFSTLETQTVSVTTEHNIILSNTVGCANYDHDAYMTCSGSVVTQDVSFIQDGYVWVIIDFPYNITNSTVWWTPPMISYEYVSGTLASAEEIALSGLPVVNSVNVLGNSSTVCTVAADESMTCFLDNSHHGFTFYYAYLAGSGLDTTTTGTFDFDIWVESPCEPEPPVDTSYCGEVGSGADDGFDWGGIEVGETACFDLGGFDLYWGFGTPADTVPWLAHICVTDISFGDLTAFDVDFDLDVVLFALGVVMLIRTMFVS